MWQPIQESICGVESTVRHTGFWGESTKTRWPACKLQKATHPQPPPLFHKTTIYNMICPSQLQEKLVISENDLHIYYLKVLQTHQSSSFNLQFSHHQKTFICIVQCSSRQTDIAYIHNADKMTSFFFFLGDDDKLMSRKPSCVLEFSSKTMSAMRL